MVTLKGGPCACPEPQLGPLVCGRNPSAFVSLGERLWSHQPLVSHADASPQLEGQPGSPEETFLSQQLAAT